jgi:O-antigen/teichoic acid export membrane protein
VSNLPKQNTTPDFSLGSFAKRSLLLLLSLSFKLLVQIVVIFVYARYLSVSDYGNYQSIWLYANVGSIIGLFGLPSLLLSISLKNIIKWVKENKVVFFLAFMLLNLIPFVVLLFFRNQFPINTRFLLLLLIIIQNVSIIAETIAIKAEKEKLVLVSNIVFNVAYLSLHIFLLYYGYSLHLLLLGLAGLYLIKTFILLFYKHHYMVQDNNTTVQAIGKQWLYLGLNDTVSVISKWLDKWVILLLLSATQFAIYFNGSYEIPVFGLMLSAVGNIMVVELSKQRVDPIKHINALFTTSSISLAAIVFPSFAFLLFYHTAFFTLIFSAKYITAIPVFFVSIFILPVRITNYTAVLQVHNKNNLIIKGTLLDIGVAIILMIVFYPLMQMKGLALAFVLSTYLQAWYYLWATSKLINKKISSFFPIKKLLGIMALSVFILGIIYFLSSKFKFPANLLLGIIMCGALILFLLYIHLKKSTLFSLHKQ